MLYLYTYINHILPLKKTKCREIYHTWMVWASFPPIKKWPCPRVFSLAVVTEGVKVSCKCVESMTPQTKAFSENWKPRPCCELFQGSIHTIWIHYYLVSEYPGLVLRPFGDPFIWFYQPIRFWKHKRSKTIELLNCDLRIATMQFQQEMFPWFAYRCVSGMIGPPSNGWSKYRP